MSSMWLGVWNGEWFGSLEPAPPGSLSGTASLHLSASGAVEASGGPRWISGTASLLFSGSGEITDTPGPRWITGTAHLGLSASGNIADASAPVSDTNDSRPWGSAGAWDAGQGYVWKDHAWVKATKVARSGVSAHWIGKATSRVIAVGVGKTMRTTQPQGSAETQTAHSTSAKVTHLMLPASPPLNPNSFSLSTTHTSIVSTYNGACETLSIDEIIALMGMAA